MRSIGAISAGAEPILELFTDRGQEGCNIVTVQALVSARLRSQTPLPFCSRDRIAGP